MNTNAVVSLLRRLESQNVWRASCNAVPAGYQNTIGNGNGWWNDDSQEESLLGLVQRQEAQQQQSIDMLLQQAQQQQQQLSHVNGHQQPMVMGGVHGGWMDGGRGIIGAQQMRHVSNCGPVAQQQYSTAAVQNEETQKEWYEDETMSVPDALKLLVDRIRETGPIKQRHLQQLYQKCENADELEKALGLTRLNYLARGELQQHDPFSHRTSSILLQQAMKIGAPDLAKRALVRSAEFGFSPANTRLFNHLLIYYSKQGDLRSMLETYELMKRAGPRPDSETCFILVKGSVDCGRGDIANAIVKEFDAMGARVRDGVRLYIQQHASGQTVQQQGA